MRESLRCFPHRAAVLACLFLAWLGAVGETAEALKHNYYTRRDHRSLIGPLGFPFGFLDSGHYNLTVFDFELSAPKKKHRHKNGEEHGGSAANDLVLADVLDNVKGAGFLLKKFRDEASFNHYMDYIRADPGRCIFQQYLDSNDDAFYDSNSDLDDYTYTDDGNYRGYGDDDFLTKNSRDYGYGYGYGIDDDLFGRHRSLRRQNDQSGRALSAFRGQQRLQEPPRNGGHRATEDTGPEGYGEALFVGGQLDGIFLDMLPVSQWKPSRPWVAYEFETGQAGFYFLMYQVCYDIEEGLYGPEHVAGNSQYDIHSRFELDFDFSNRDMFGRISYLSRGEMILPWLFFLFSIMYALCLCLWHANIKAINDGKQGYFDTGEEPTTEAPARSGIPGTPDAPTIYPIHYLMGFLLALKYCSLLFESLRYHYLRVTGHAVFFSAVYYTFDFLKGITLFTVVLLIGSGWSFVKPFLSDREKKMIFGILVLQVINNIAIVVLTQETEGETSFDTWTAILHLVDILCCCAVLIPIVWQVNQLEKNMDQNNHKGKDDFDENGGSEEASFLNSNGDDHIPEDELDDVPMETSSGETERIPDARLASKLKLFRSFYLLVIGYIYTTRIVVYLFSATLNYKHTWVSVFVVESATIAFYCAVGYMFRPMNEDPTLPHRRRGQDSDKGAQVEMKKIDTSTKVALD